MKKITVKTQAEFDALPAKFSEWTRIYIQNDAKIGRIVVCVKRGNSSVEAWGNSSVVARGNSSVEAWGNSSVVALENSSVVARENSSVEAHGNSSVVALENSSVVARGNSSVEAWENSSVVALENSSVVAWENSSVEAWGNSSVVACGNSSVVARENSSVEAWGNSSVEAWGNVGLHIQSDAVSATLYMFAVCWLLAKKAKITKKSETATIIIPEIKTGISSWLESQGIEPSKDNVLLFKRVSSVFVLLFKRVSSVFKTQEGTANETIWAPGQRLSHPAWEPKTSECGSGKFHACSRPYFCDEFRSLPEDKYIAIEVAVSDLFAWENPQYPHKIAFRSGTVLYECDKFGKEIK